MSEQEQKGMPFPTPSIEGDGDNEHLLHQQASGPLQTVEAMKLAAAGYEAFLEMAQLQVTQETHNALADAVQAATLQASEILSKVPMPLLDGIEQPEGDEPHVYMPYVMLVALQLLAVAAAESMTDLTVADRYAWISEFVRSWASFGACSAAHKAGIKDSEKIRNIVGVAITQQPIPLGMLAALSASRRAIFAEAKERGISVEELLSERSAAAPATDKVELVM